MRQRTRSSLAHIMACRLFDAKPLSEQMLVYCELVRWEQTSGKFESKYDDFHSRKFILKCRLRHGSHLSLPQYVNPWRADEAYMCQCTRSSLVRYRYHTDHIFNVYIYTYIYIYITLLKSFDEELNDILHLPHPVGPKRAEPL